MYYFAEGVTVKVLNSYTENIESSGWFGRFMKNARQRRPKTLAWHLTIAVIIHLYRNHLYQDYLFLSPSHPCQEQL